jgi:hypothetical protein
VEHGRLVQELAADRDQAFNDLSVLLQLFQVSQTLPDHTHRVFLLIRKIKHRSCGALGKPPSRFKTSQRQKQTL